MESQKTKGGEYDFGGPRWYVFNTYRKSPKISSEAYIFQRPFWGAYLWRGLCTEGNSRFKIDWVSVIFGKKFTVFLCLTLYYRTISKYKPPEAYNRRGDLTEGFLRYEFGGPVIFGGAYTWKALFSEFYGFFLTFDAAFSRKTSEPGNWGTWAFAPRDIAAHVEFCKMFRILSQYVSLCMNASS